MEIPEVGEFALEAFNDEQFYYYLIVKTVLGRTMITTYGPIIPDVHMLPSGFKITYDTIDYKEDKIMKTINFFLNDKSKVLTEAKIVDADYAIKQIPNLVEYIEQGVF